jgi:hypothetical protein
MTTTLATRLASLFTSLSWRRRAAAPRLDSLNLSEHDLADLNLPPSVRARLSTRHFTSFGDLV